jgi:hypothetical protein
MNNRKGVVILMISVFIALLIYVSTIIKTSYTITSKAFFMPSLEFNLIRTPDGNLITTLKDNSAGIVKNYGISQFERGDVVQFMVSEKLIKEKYLNKGDTIGWILSNEQQKLLIQLNGELGILKAELDFYTTGQKPEDIQTAKEQLELAKEQLEIQKKLIKRNTVLFNDSVIPQQEYDIQLNNLKVKEIEVAIAEARYLSITTGQKKEQERLILAKIKNIESQIGQVSSRLAYFTFVSPISGVMIAQRGMDTIFGGNVISIGNTEKWIGLVPVQLKERSYIHIGDTIRSTSSYGVITGIDNNVKIIDARQAFYVTTEWTSKNEILPGAISEVNIIGERITLSDYLLRIFAIEPGK